MGWYDAARMSYHEAHLTPDGARRVVWRVIAEHLAPWIPPSAAVLELGAGYCDWINHVQAARRVATDVWPDFAVHAASGVETRVLDAGKDVATLPDAGFDVVLASNLLEHFEPDVTAALVREVCRVLRPGGRFLIVQPNFRYAYRSYFDDYTHRAIFTDVSLPALLRASGFAIDHVDPTFVPYSMQGSAITPRAWMVRAYLASPFRPRAGQMCVVARKA